MHAQQARSAAADAKQDSVDRNLAPDLDLRTGLAGSGIQVLAGSDSTNVILAASRRWDTAAPERLGFALASLVFNAPITDKKKGQGAFVTEGGLAKSLSVQGSLTYTFSGNPPDFIDSPRRVALLKRRIAACEQRATNTAVKAKCATLNYAEDGGELADSWMDAPLFLLGISGAVGHKPFEYRRLADLAKQETDRTEYAFSVSGGVNPNSRPVYLGVGLEYRRQYVAASSRILCQPAASGAAQECFSGAFAEPARDIDSSVFATARWRGVLPIGTGLPLGVAIKAAYDTKDKVFGVGVPIYLVPDATGGLRGGVRLDWQDVDDEDERLAVRVFVGAPFTLFGGG